MKLININTNFVPSALRQPTETGEYIVFIDHGNSSYITTLTWSNRHKLWNVRDEDDDTHTAIEVNAWTPFRPIAQKLKEVLHD